MSDPGPQLALLDLEEPWKAEWRGMPEYHQEDLTPAWSLLVHFESFEDATRFAELVGQNLTPNTRSIWYPEAEITRMVDKRYIREEETP